MESINFILFIQLDHSLIFIIIIEVILSFTCHFCLGGLHATLVYIIDIFFRGFFCFLVLGFVLIILVIINRVVRFLPLLYFFILRLGILFGSLLGF